MADRAFLDRMVRELADKGKLVEAGWVSFRILVLSPTAGAEQLEMMRLAFMAGAQHLFGSIAGGMGVLDPDAEPTEMDLHRMDLIDQELRGFVEEFKQRFPGGKTGVRH